MAITSASVANVRAALLAGKLNNESKVRQDIVYRFLDEAGFDIYNSDEVIPEETNSGGKRPDFIIKVGNGRFAIELKSANIKIDKRNFDQTLNYVGNLGIRYAILTNGKKWIFLDEGMRGRYEDRVLFVLDIDILSDEDFAHLISLALEKSIWAEGAFIMNARRIQNLIKDREAPDEEILMYFKTHNLENKTLIASARAIYNFRYGTWTILTGSTALNRSQGHKSVGNGLARRRRKYIAEGRIFLREDGLLEYLDDIMYESQTVAASDIAGNHRSKISRNWKDKFGNPPRKLIEEENP